MLVGKPQRAAASDMTDKLHSFIDLLVWLCFISFLFKVKQEQRAFPLVKIFRVVKLL